MKAWVYQRKEQVAKFGAKLAPWYCGWRTPAGRLRAKSCGVGPIGRSAARALAEVRHAELVLGTYAEDVVETGPTIAETVSRFMAAKRNRAKPRTIEYYEQKLGRFVGFFDPDRKLVSLKTADLDLYIADRLEPEGDAEAVAAATINADLRAVRALLNFAVKRDIIARVPAIEFLREDESLVTFVRPEEIQLLYGAADQARRPALRNVAPADWWRGLIVFASLTGWRITQMLLLRREDVDLDRAVAITRASDNKGRRDHEVQLHPLIVEHLRPLWGAFEPLVFPFPHSPWSLYREFHDLQDGAGLRRGGRAGGHFGFHDLRRGFATQNASRLTAFQLQHVMQHRSLQTTQKYVAMGTPVLDSVDALAVPPIRPKRPRRKKGG